MSQPEETPDWRYLQLLTDFEGLLTTHAGQPSQDPGLTIGFDTYLQKPHLTIAETFPAPSGDSTTLYTDYIFNGNGVLTKDTETEVASEKAAFEAGAEARRAHQEQMIADIRARTGASEEEAWQEMFRRTLEGTVALGIDLLKQRLDQDQAEEDLGVPTVDADELDGLVQRIRAAYGLG